MTLVAAFASAQFGDLHTLTGYTMHEKEGQCPQVFAFSSDRSDLRRDEQVANVENKPHEYAWLVLRDSNPTLVHS